jgi:hypothetical protein
MATTDRRNIPEADAEQQVFDSVARLDKLRIADLKAIAEEQQWKSNVLKAELERLEPVITRQHPRLIRMQALLEHYNQSNEAINILVNAKDDNEGPLTGEPWILSGIVRSEKLPSAAGLKVVLEPQGKELAPLEAECNADGFYRMMLEAEPMRQYMDVPMMLRVYNKNAKRPVFTAGEPVFIKPGEQRQDINIP